MAELTTSLLLIFIFLLLVLIIIGIPVAWSLLLTGAIGAFYMIGIERGIGLIYTTVISEVSVYLFATIPLFILMAEFISQSKIIDDMFKAIHAWTSGIKGGIAMAVAIASGGIAAIAGSSTGAVAAIARIAVPQMREYDYSDVLAVGTVSSAGTFAAMIPPSLALILYGILTDTSIPQLFIAGIVPGVLTIVSYILLIYVWGVYDPSAVGSTVKNDYSWRYRFIVLKPVYPAVLLAIVVLGGIYTGAMTPTESGGVGAAGALLIALLFSDLDLRGINIAIENTIEITVMIFMILIGAMLFARFLAIAGIRDFIVSFVSGLGTSPLLILLVIILMYVMMGTLMNQSAVLILTLPITYPIVVEGLGYNPIWFGILLVKTVEIGLITPPLGLNVYIVSGAVDVDLGTVFKGAMRFLIVDSTIIAILILMPEIVLYLPSTMG